MQTAYPKIPPVYRSSARSRTRKLRWVNLSCKNWKINWRTSNHDIRSLTHSVQVDRKPKWLLLHVIVILAQSWKYLPPSCSCTSNRVNSIVAWLNCPLCSYKLFSTSLWPVVSPEHSKSAWLIDIRLLAVIVAHSCWCSTVCNVLNAHVRLLEVMRSMYQLKNVLYM